MKFCTISNFRVSGWKDDFPILGPNGVGKTTLLQMHDGAASLGKKERAASTDRISAKLPGARSYGKRSRMCRRQRGNALMYTAEEMVLLGRCAHLGMMQQPRQEDVEAGAAGHGARRRHAACAVKLCSQMSGGELQMILIARALTTRAVHAGAGRAGIQFGF